MLDWVVGYIDANENGRGDMEYDIISEGRYHHQVMALREEIHDLSPGRPQKQFAKKLGMLVGKWTPHASVYQLMYLLTLPGHL